MNKYAALIIFSSLSLFLAGCMDSLTGNQDDNDDDSPQVTAAFSSANELFYPGEVQPLMLQNYQVTEPVQAYVQGRLFILYPDPDNDRSLLFIVPDGIIGSMRLELQLRTATLDIPFSVAEHEPIAEPLVFIEENLTQLTEEIESRIATIQAVDSSAVQRWEPLYAEYTQFLEELTDLPEAEVRQIANVLNRYLFVETVAEKRQMTPFQMSTSFCQNALEQLNRGVDEAVKISVLGTILTGIGNQFMKVVGFLRQFEMLNNLIDKFNNLTLCFEKELSLIGVSGKIRDSSQHPTSVRTFDHNESQVVGFQLVGWYPPEALTLINEVQEAFQEVVDYIPASWVELIYETDLNGSILPIEQPLQVVGASNPQVVYSAELLQADQSPSRADLQVVFEFPKQADPAQNLDFDLTVAIEDVDYDLAVQLYPPLPTLIDQEYTTLPNEALTDNIQAEYAASLEITRSPANGTITFDAASPRQFTYTPNEGYSGNDTFELKAQNVKGESETGVFSIDIVYEEECITWRDLEYCTVENPETGRIWLDRNLGANRVATSRNDAQAYGDSYQWGRGTDGHQKRNSPTTTTLSNSDQPGHGSFILAPNSPYDWRSPQNNNRWQGVNGINNPCPTGYRLPTEAEWSAERRSWNNNNASGAIESPLKLPLAGGRIYNSPTPIYGVGTHGGYWSSSISGFAAWALEILSTNTNMRSSFRGDGLSVRCIRD